MYRLSHETGDADDFLDALPALVQVDHAGVRDV